MTCACSLCIAIRKIMSSEGLLPCPLRPRAGPQTELRVLTGDLRMSAKKWRLMAAPGVTVILCKPIGFPIHSEPRGGDQAYRDHLGWVGVADGQALSRIFTPGDWSEQLVSSLII